MAAATLMVFAAHMGWQQQNRRRFKEAAYRPGRPSIDDFRACERTAAMLAATGLLVSQPLLAEPHLLGEARTCGGVVRRHHGIVAAKTPVLAILRWCEV